MLFHERQYQLHVILGNPASPLLWTRQGWLAVESELLDVLAVVPGAKSMQSLQYNGSKPASLGRIGLDKASLEKWIHDEYRYPERSQWLFCSNELWSPGRTACEKRNLPPDLYFGFRNEASYARSSHNPYIILAGALDKGTAFITLVDKFADALITSTNAVEYCSKKTTWGHSTGSSSFTDAIGDLLGHSVKTW